MFNSRKSFRRSYPRTGFAAPGSAGISAGSFLDEPADKDASAPSLGCHRAVAQICNLLYRGFATRWAHNIPAHPVHVSLPIANRRYGRLQICATSRGARGVRPVETLCRNCVNRRHCITNTAQPAPVSCPVRPGQIGVHSCSFAVILPHFCFLLSQFQLFPLWLLLTDFTFENTVEPCVWFRTPMFSLQPFGAARARAGNCSGVSCVVFMLR